MDRLQLAAAAAEARKVHAERVDCLKQQVADERDPKAKRDLLRQLLRLQSLRRPSLRVRRGTQAFAEHAQIHAGGGSYKELRLTLFIATHMRGLAYSPYGDDDQSHACHFLFDCCLYELGLWAVYFYRHLSPDAGKHYTATMPTRAKILTDFLLHVENAELDAATAGKQYELDSETVLSYAKRMYKDTWGTSKKAIGVPPWVPAAVRGR